MTLQEIQTSIEKLSPKELAHFRRWFYAFDAQVWDEQFEADVQAGKLDKIAEQALEEYRSGDVKAL